MPDAAAKPRRTRGVRPPFDEIFRSERYTSVLLLVAAGAGLVLANTAPAATAIEVNETPLAIPWLGLELSVGEWVADLLLAVFFFIVAVELRDEMTNGELNSVRKALVPAIGAAGGVVGPALIFVVMVGGGELARGWPVPTATDVAFAVGVLAVFGRHLPNRMRVFLLALAVIDDLIGIAFIAVIFSADLDPLALVGGAVAVACFGVVSAVRRLPRAVRIPLLAVLALLAWYLVHQGGIHPTIAGVALGLVMSPAPAQRVTHALVPWSNGLILPVFALTAALVTVPAADRIGPVLVALAVALPLGKAMGIFLGGSIGARIAAAHNPTPVVGWDLVALGVTGGLGFTVALLMAQLAFEGDRAVADQGVLGVLIGSAVSLGAGALLIWWRSRVHLARQLAGSETTEILTL